MFAAGKMILAVAGLIFVSLPFQAMAVTIQEMGDLQLQIKKKEMTEALEKKTDKSAPAAAVPKFAPNLPVEPGSGGDIKLVAVYGVNDDLAADVLYNGAVFAVKEKDRVAGWEVGKILPSRIEITQKGRRRELTLSVKPTPVPLPPASGAGFAGAPPPPSY